VGWALKTIKKKVRFTKKQTEFLADQFQKEKPSGRKSDPQEVSKAMSSARDQAGKADFNLMKSLRRSRLVASLAVFQQRSDEDEISAEVESHLSALCANVMRGVAIHHPIVSFDLNICELVQKRTLTALRVDRLRDMCIDLGLDVSDISPQKRKKPYIARLTQLIQECTCSSK